MLNTLVNKFGALMGSLWAIHIATLVNISKPLIHFNSSTKPIEFRVAIGISSFVAV